MSTPSGWATPIGGWTEPQSVLGLVCDERFPAAALGAVIGGGKRFRPDAVWVVRGTDQRAREALALSGIEPVLAPLVAFFAVGVDHRARWRDCEIAAYCERTYVCRVEGTQATAWWSKTPHPGIRVLFEEGDERPKPVPGLEGASA